MVRSAMRAFPNMQGSRNACTFRVCYISFYIVTVFAFALSVPTVHAVPFGEIHRNIFPLSVARLTRSVLYGRETSPTPSTPAIPTVPLKDVQELSYPNPAVDTVAALAPVENQQQRELSQEVQSHQSQQQFLVSEDATATTLSVTPTPIPALDAPVSAQSDNGTTEESQRSIIVTSDYSTGQQVTQPSVGNMQGTFTTSDATSVLSNMESANSSPETQPRQPGYSEEVFQRSQTSLPSQEAQAQTAGILQANSNNSIAESAPTSEKSEQSSPTTYNQYVAAAPESRSRPDMQRMDDVGANTVSQPSDPTSGQQARNAILQSGTGRKEDVNDSSKYGVTEINDHKEVRNNDKTEKQEVKAMPALERRVYSTNLLPGCKKDSPSLLPPGFGGKDAANKTILDVGSHIGDDYTIRGVSVGHTVIAFEPSPAVVDNFKKYMIQKGMPLSVVNLDHAVATAAHARGRLARDAIDGMVVRVLIPRTSRLSGNGGGNAMGNGGIDMSQARVFLMPFALSNETGLTKFFESGCKMPHCGKVNRIPMQDADSVTGNIVVPKYKLDDLILPTDTRKIWFLKVDVEGHELEVLQGARDLIRRSGLEYIVLEFSPNGQPGVKWGVTLLNELFEQGFTCFHMRGFGKCHDDTLRSPSLKCNFPFNLNNATLAPTFEEYAKVFEIKEENGRKKPHMADLMCKRRKMDY